MRGSGPIPNPYSTISRHSGGLLAPTRPGLYSILQADFQADSYLHAVA